MDILLEANNISGGYDEEMIIRDFSLRLERGEFLGIIGPNGSGKSTLLRLLTRILVPRIGNISLGGEDIARMDRKELSRKLAFVSQNTFVNFSFSVWEMVLMGRIPHLARLQSETKKDFMIAEKALSLTDTLHLKNRKIDELSAGERQRVILAKALAQEPSLLFLDEPTAHLDIGHQIQALDLVKKMNIENGITVVIVLHDLNLAAEYCDRIILLEKGRTFAEGRPEEVLSYQNIEAVYKTVVVVNKNPVNSKPHVVLVPGGEMHVN